VPFFFDLLASGLRYIYTEARYIMRVIVGGMRRGKGTEGLRNGTGCRAAVM
jgi:hypothetical protein